MHKRFKLQKKYGVPCDKKSRFLPRDIPLFFFDNQNDEKQFHRLNYFPEKKAKTGLEKALCSTLAKMPERCSFSRFAVDGKNVRMKNGKSRSHELVRE